MHADISLIVLRNTLCSVLFLFLALSLHRPVLEQELLKIWKILNRPMLPKKPATTNHRSNKFWEIDMTKFEP